MAGNETMFDAPVTPAPVFAYRALRGIFFASPESSPVAAPRNDDKENMPPVYDSASLPPIKSAKPTMLDRDLTPQKRIRNASTALVSPTKGILRTPGLPTPRAKALRDVNVKFKSVSPEVRAEREAKIRALEALSPPQPTGQIKLGKKVRSSEAKPANKHASDAPKTSQPKVPAPTQPPALEPGSSDTIPTLVPEQMSAYMAQTEKEMKKLVRYGQKMREYARKKDAENAELQLMIARLQRENARLTSEAAGKSQRSNGGHAAPTPPEADWEQQEREREHAAETDALFDLLHAPPVPTTKARKKTGKTTKSPSAPPGYVRHEVARFEAGAKSDPVAAEARATSTQPRPSVRGPREQPSTASRSRTTEPQNDDRRNAEGKRHSCPEEVPPPPAAEVPGLHDDDGRTSTAARSVRLPPDRMAAARERLRAKRAARITSREAEVERESAGESGIDWAGL